MCCCGLLSCLCGGACSCCSSAVSEHTIRQQIRFIYVIMFLLFLIPNLLILFLLSNYQWWISIISWFISCPGGNDFVACLSVSAIYRMSFALALMFFLIFLACTMKNECSRIVNEELWPIKIFGIILIFIISLWISNSFFETYASVGTVLTSLFFLFQIIMIIDICYLWGERWVKYYDDGAQIWGAMLIIVSLGLYASIIYWNIELFNNLGSCNDGSKFVIINAILIVIVTLMVILRINPNGSILTTGGVGLFTTYMTWSALDTPNLFCNGGGQNSLTSFIQLAVGLFLIIISLSYVSLGNKDESSGHLGVGGNIDLAGQILEEKKTEEEQEKEKELDEEMDKQPKVENDNTQIKAKPIKGNLGDYKGSKYVYFHLIMFLASIYSALMMTNFGNSYVNGQYWNNYTTSELTAYMQLATSWVTMGLYIWTLIAPRIFPDRNFRVDTE